jgi:hypothetical protein
MAFSVIGCVKLGQPELESNLMVESKSGELQQIQWYFPASYIEHNSPEKGLSVPFCLVILNCSGVKISRHSVSVFLMILSGVGFPVEAK